MSDTSTTLVAIVALLALVGNVLITLVGLKLPAHPKNLTQIFLISLSVADIILSLQVPFYILGLQNEEWGYFPQVGETPGNPTAEPSTTVFCSISSFLLWTTIKANIFMVMVMGFDRMVATCYAATYLKTVKRQYAQVACTIVWILSFLLAALPGVITVITTDNNPYSYDHRFRTCTPFPDFCHKQGSGTHKHMSHFLVYFLIELVVTFFIPLICITICYFLICSKIFNLKKIRTISRHFSKKQIFKSAKSDKNKDSKPSSPEEGASKDKFNENYPSNSNPSDKSKEKDSSFAMITSEEQSAEGEHKKQESRISEQSRSGFRINMNHTAEHQISEESVYPVDTKPQGYKLNISSSPPVKQPKFGLYPNSSRVSNECNDECSNKECSEVIPSTRKALSLYPDTVNIGEECSEETLPNMTEPQLYSIDPNMQRRRFNFFTSGEDDEFAECPEPGSKTGILASSINVIEKHYNAIEAAQKELAKKMRVYKYQIRVARTAVVVCTFFFMCYLVYEIGTLYVMWGVACDDKDPDSKINLFIKSSHGFLFLNSALNVLVYGLMHRTVRAHLSKICAACTAKSANSSS
ncbi:uncharacterized protein LOC134825165 isoform X2 [Bolinopsis microptera]|uniref:uncharacterized protein LOC134825165 isoform X2 n=1 Tax=Bolinopsis microptera TaxID=2820187 RepID=UPI003079AE5A